MNLPAKVYNSLSIANSSAISEIEDRGMGSARFRRSERIYRTPRRNYHVVRHRK